MAHLAHTNWKLRDRTLFAADHRKIVTSRSQWIIEGNYSFLMQERFSRATSIIWLDFGVSGSIYRYLKRTWANPSDRPGNLVGAKNYVSFRHLHHMIFTAPKKRSEYHRRISQSNAQLVRLQTFSQLQAYYQFWGLHVR
jgi:adenylate kinase family enzyme